MKIYKGKIITCDPENNVFKYLIEENGIIKFVGDVLPEQYKGIELFDLGNRALLPAFSDTHIHFSSYALFASTLDVRAASNFQELGGIINDYSKRSNDKVLLGFGLSAHSLKEQRLITREELDELYSKRPLMIIKYDGHASIVNSKMLELLPKELASLRGFNPDSGHLTQESYFKGTDFITNKVSAIKLIRNILKGFDIVAEKGIGMIHAVEGVGFPRDLDVDLMRFISKGLRNPFQVRLFFQTMDIAKVQKRKLPRIGGCFANALDGSFGSVDAALLEPYSNDDNNRGVLYYPDDEVSKFTIAANRAGLQIQMHAIGDAAFEQAVKALDTALKDFPRTDHRHTIIHACLPTKPGLEKCAELGIGIAAQPKFLDWNLEPLHYFETILGERAYQQSPFRDMLDSGIHVSGGSDAPCTEPDPIAGIYAACNHFVPEQSVSIQEALKMFTS
ncbi:amidohydrolase family protein, partial [Candidatus Dependentiae bacterium]|nr:amidohydrolase family protein [Candidatus Dependentiae bacterium]